MRIEAQVAVRHAGLVILSEQLEGELVSLVHLAAAAGGHQGTGGSEEGSVSSEALPASRLCRYAGKGLSMRCICV